MEFHVSIDGGVEPNPGKNAAVGVVVKRKELDGSFKHIHEFGHKLKGNRDYTNNFVEWVAPYVATKWLVEYSLENPTKIVFYSDSQLLVNQANGSFKVNYEKSYAEAYTATTEYLKKVKSVEGNPIEFEFIKIPRERNSEADTIASNLMKNHGKENMAF